MTMTIGSFAVTALPDGAAVQFPITDPALLPRFKKAFPRARFHRATRSWHVPGVLAASRVSRFANAVAQEEHAAQAKADQLLRDAEFERRPIPLDTPGLDGRAYLAARAENGQRLSTRHIHVSVRDDHVRVGFAYDAEAVAVVRMVPGARFLPDLRAWAVPVANVRGLYDVIDRMEDSLARASAAAAVAREQGVDEADQEAAAQARRAGRVLMLIALRPVVGTLVRVGSEPRVIEGFGRAFPLDVKTARAIGSHLHGQEASPAATPTPVPQRPEKPQPSRRTRPPEQSSGNAFYSPLEPGRSHVDRRPFTGSSF